MKKKALTDAEAINGYIEDFSFNPNWKKQRAVCGYEHCIELMPLYGFTRKQAIEDNKRSKECLKKGIFKSGKKIDKFMVNLMKKEVKDFNSLDYPITVDTSKSCPIFGHNCPGNLEMVQKCARQQNNISEERFNNSDN